MMGTSWRSIIRRRTMRNWMEKLWSRGIRREGCVCPGSGAIGVWKSSKLKIGITQASRSIPIGIGASLGRYCGGQDWRLEFRAATKSGKDLKYGLRSDPPGALHPSVIQSSTRTALTPFRSFQGPVPSAIPKGYRTLRPDHERRELADQGAVQPASICFFIENDQCVWERQVPPIRSIAGQCVADVHDLECADGQRYLFTVQAVRVAAAIHAFMMVANEGQYMAERFERRADLLSNEGVFLDNLALGGIERTGLGKYPIGDSDFADIVEQPRDSQRVKIVLGQTKALSESHRIVGNAHTMRLLKWISHFDALWERKEYGFSLFVDVGFHLQHRMDPAEGLPRRRGVPPEIVGPGANGS